MKILILPNNQYQTISKEAPKEGHYYGLMLYEPGTEDQNRAFHSLLVAFFNWMFHTNQYQFEDNGIIYDLRCATAAEFKILFKVRYGAGFTPYIYFDLDGKQKKVAHKDDIPQEIINRYYGINVKKEPWRIVMPQPKSWRDYTKRQRMDAITNLRVIIAVSMCDDKKVHEILDGMDRKAAELEAERLKKEKEQMKK
jgi:hypothetical protein